MAGVDLSPPMLWIVVIGLSIGTFGLRLSFIQLIDDEKDISLLSERALELIPAAVLAALIVPSVLLTDGMLQLSTESPRLVAALVALLVSWKTRSLLLTLVAGMGVFWLLLFGL